MSSVFDREAQFVFVGEPDGGLYVGGTGRHNGVGRRVSEGVPQLEVACRLVRTELILDVWHSRNMIQFQDG